MKIKTCFIFIIVLLAVSFFSCSSDMDGQKKDQNTGTLIKTEVVAHTSGEISCRDSIQIQFSSDVVYNYQIDTPLEPSPIAFNPDIQGVAKWVDRRTLEFIPDKKLISGQEYSAVVTLPKLAKESGNKAGRYEFDFSVIRQTFDLEILGLKASLSKNIAGQELQGVISTADQVDNGRIEKIIKASQKGIKLPVKWTHNDREKSHSFVITGITRDKEFLSEVLISWDGAPVGVDRKGKRKIRVPPLSTFKVSQVRAVHGRTQYIEIRFSDPLKKDQSLDGLIRAGTDNKGLKFTVDGNIINIYSSKLWHDIVNVKINKGIRNISGFRLAENKTFTVSFEKIKPEVRFAGKGVVFPTTFNLSIPIEAINLKGVTIKVTKIVENNIPQFLQVNNLDGKYQLNRVGTVIWEKRFDLDTGVNKSKPTNQWIRYGLDMSQLIKKSSGGLFRLELSFSRSDILYDCSKSSWSIPRKQNSPSIENGQEEESFWDSWEEISEDDYYEFRNNRKNPCHPAYYKHYWDHDIKVSRNVLISDVGIIAKKGSNNNLFIAVTDIKTASPLVNIDLYVYSFQHELITTCKSDENGMVNLECKKDPYLIIAKHGSQKGYLRLQDGQALSVSHFDTSGASIQQGLKGFIYGERGVWRPGDPIYLTFILMDKNKKLPPDHPVIFDLRNSRGQLVKRVRKKKSSNGFFSVKFDTDQDAVTGNWTAEVKVGGVTFKKTIKVENIRPNRLKVNLDFGKDVKSLKGKLVQGTLSSTWLHGAVAKNLKADVKLSFTTGRTTFPGYRGYVFDDPARKYYPEENNIFKGNLDKKGRAVIKAKIRVNALSPGILMANFTSRVFEPGGSFSVNQYSIPYHPYKRYVGIQLPRGDKARGMLLTDEEHRVGIVMVDASGKPVPGAEVEVELYKIKWRWWWAKGDETLADYIGRTSYKAIKKERVRIKNGKGEWTFSIKYPSWGRYLVRVRDLTGKHSTGRIAYIDWPGWAGRSMDNMPGGASVLSFSADKESCRVGEKVVLTIPGAKTGRGLISFETGSKILKTEWFKPGDKGAARVEFTATKDMAPNVYVHVTFLQPHMQTGNDLPVRMYGVIPVKVFDPETRVLPKISCADVFVPDSKTSIKVMEKKGRAMTYTLAIVDDGLLDLTNYRTPDPWNYFYKRESLGVKTWDIYNYVAGAYGGALENLLAIGGDESLMHSKSKKANRFPPMVRFLGPFDLKQGAVNTHEVDIPKYLGSVRVMVVAGSGDAFGFDEKSVFVRKPLMLLGSLPRVLGPNEEVSLPVSVFAMEDKIKDVRITIRTNKFFSIEGSDIRLATKKITFTETGDQIVFFKLKTGSLPGVGKVTMKAICKDESVEQTMEISIRIPSEKIVDGFGTSLAPGETWEKEVKFPGITGTNRALLEVSRIPPLNLGKRLGYLIRYPHGCVEQTTSSVFPQLYLDKLLKLTSARQDRIQANITAGIRRLGTFQTADGGFSYWPGSWEADPWGTNYAGHFLLEAKKAGYSIPSGLLENWKIFQKNMADSWSSGSYRSELIQAYRLYTLALAGVPELGAMNRLREQTRLSSLVKYRLASAYELAGQPEASAELINNTSIRIHKYRELSNTYGSDLRDKAMILESLCLMGLREKADSLAGEISAALNNDEWMSTQTTAYSLIAMSAFAGICDKTGKTVFDITWNNENPGIISMVSPVIQKELGINGTAQGKIKIVNRSKSRIYPRLILTGIPEPGKEKSARNGLMLAVKYHLPNGDRIDPAKLAQGTDFVAEVTVYNISGNGSYEEVALTHIFPSGWEIHNTRMDLNHTRKKDRAFEYQDIRDDRVLTYFDLKEQERKTFRVLLNAGYIGRYYKPMVMVETMYDAAINARVSGGWIVVAEQGADD